MDFAEKQKKHETTQKKTFGKWFNMHLRKKQCPPVEDLETDLDDGSALINLINILYQLPMPKYNKKPKMKAHKLDNLEIALKMVQSTGLTTINFTMLSPHNVVGHEVKLILGMVWGIILDYQIKGISVDELTAKEGLLQWCRNVTKSYDNVDIQNFHRSFKDGLAFNAIIHHFAPHLIDYDSMSAENSRANCENAFNVADDNFQIPKLLDPEDLEVDLPDEKSVMTYISEYYHKFSNLEKGRAASERVNRFLNLVKTTEELKENYTKNSPPFVQWLDKKISDLKDMSFDTTPNGLKAELNRLKEFQSNEKAKKVATKYELQGKYYTLDALVTANNLKSYSPPEGAEPETVDAKWDELEAAEKERAEKLGNLLEEEFKKIFEKFDADKDGHLSLIEFKAVLTSLGFVLAEDELQELFANLEANEDGAKLLPFDKFHSFMIQQFVKEVDTPSGVKRAFKAVADSKSYVSKEDLSSLNPALDSSLLSWTLDTIPTTEGGYDYATFVDSQFEEY